jgi:plastocyanin
VTTLAACSDNRCLVQLGGLDVRKPALLAAVALAAHVVVTFAKKGKFRYLCTVPGHAAAGMKGTFTVR